MAKRKTYSASFKSKIVPETIRKDLALARPVPSMRSAPP